MTMRNIILKATGWAALAASVLFPVKADAQQTRLLTPDRYNDYGLVYSLPLTKLCVTVDVKHTVRRAGPFYQYAKKYLGVADPISADEDIWEITGVNVTTFGVPDSLEYQMQLKPGVPTNITVSDSGMLLAINTSAGAPASLPERQMKSSLTLPGANDYLKYVDEDFLASQSSAKRAQNLSEALLEIRSSRLSLTRGTAETMPVDGRQLELMLADLTKQEEAMSRAFTGVEMSENLREVFTFMPEDSGKTVLTRLCDFEGFVDADDYSGEPLYITVRITREGEIPVDAKGSPAKMPKDAVAYCVPGAAQVSLSFRGNTLFSKEFDMAQFGVVFGLNPSLFSDKKAPSCAVFDPATGALVKLAEAPRAE